MNTQHRYILMVEDDPDDRYLTQQTLQDIGVSVPVQFLSQSTEVFSFLERHEPPAIILIDYNISPDSGVEVLKRLKSHPAYRHIPVIILSESAAPAHVTECYLHGANSFVAKPFTSDGTRKKIERFFTYWLDVVEVG